MIEKDFEVLWKYFIPWERGRAYFVEEIKYMSKEVFSVRRTLEENCSSGLC